MDVFFRNGSASICSNLGFEVVEASFIAAAIGTTTSFGIVKPESDTSSPSTPLDNSVLASV